MSAQRVTLGTIFFTQDGTRRGCFTHDGQRASVALPFDGPSAGDNVLVEPHRIDGWRLVTAGEATPA